MRKFIRNICIVSAIALSVYSCGFGGKSRTYVDAISVNDYVTAHKILDSYLQKAIDKNASSSKGDYESIEMFWGAATHIYKAEMMYLIEMNDLGANKRLINTLATMNVIGNKPSEKVSYFMDSKEYSYYIFIKSYNLLCDEILNISFLNNNRDMAKQVLMMYKEDVLASPRPYGNGKRYYYYFTFSYQSRDVATKKYNDAIKNGLLN